MHLRKKNIIPHGDKKPIVEQIVKPFEKPDTGTSGEADQDGSSANK